MYTLCIKDMAASLKTQPAYDIVKAIKESLGEQVRIHVHVHATTGVALVSLMKAIEADADVVDTSTSSLSLGPDTIRRRAWWKCWKARATT